MKIIIRGLLLIIFGVTSSWLASSPETHPAAADAPERSALPVTTVSLEPIFSIERDRQFTGTVAASRRTKLAFERPARLLQVMCDEGQKVASGQILATIDQRQLLARVSEIEAGIRQQDAVLQELKAGPRSEVIAASEAELAALSADVELRKATFDRTQGLLKRQATSAQALDEVRLTWKASVAKQEAATKKRDELVSGTRHEQISAQVAAIEQLEAQLKQLNIDITDSHLKAPFSGTIVRREADEGDMLSPQQTVLELLETSQLEARIGVPSEFIDSLDRDGYVVMTADQRTVTGRIRDVIAQVDRATRTQTVVIDIDDAENCGLADGALIRLAFSQTQDIEGFRVPLTALASGSRGLWSAYIVEPTNNDPTVTKIVARAVEVIHTDGEMAVIRGAIYEGERIVTDGVHRVVRGQRVTDLSAAVTKD